MPEDYNNYRAWTLLGEATLTSDPAEAMKALEHARDLPVEDERGNENIHLQRLGQLYLATEQYGLARDTFLRSVVDDTWQPIHNNPNHMSTHLDD